MRGGIVVIAFIIVVGVIIANTLANPRGTKVVFDGITGLWRTSVNGLLGKTTSA